MYSTRPGLSPAPTPPPLLPSLPYPLPRPPFAPGLHPPPPIVSILPTFLTYPCSVPLVLSIFHFFFLSFSRYTFPSNLLSLPSLFLPPSPVTPPLFLLPCLSIRYSLSLFSSPSFSFPPVPAGSRLDRPFPNYLMSKPPANPANNFSQPNPPSSLPPLPLPLLPSPLYPTLPAPPHLPHLPPHFSHIPSQCFTVCE